MPKMKLTAAAIERLTPPATGQIDYFDVGFPAFGLRVSQKGAKSFFVMLRIHGKLTRLTLGRAKVGADGQGLTLADARKKAGDCVDLAHNGADPRQVKERERAANEEKAKNTFGALAGQFLTKYVDQRIAAGKLSKKTKLEYVRVLQGSDTEKWKDTPITNIAPRDVRELLDAISERGAPVAANNTLAYLRRFFNWCAEKEVLGVPPTVRIKAPNPKTIGERVLSNAELVDVWNACGPEAGTFGPMVRLLLLLGQRRGEVSGLMEGELRELDGDKPIWEIPGTRTKNRRPHLVPLAPEAVKILNAVPRIVTISPGADSVTSPFYFTTTGKTPVSGFSKAKARIDEAISTARKKAGREPMPAWDFHDLRRTMVTAMNELLKVPPHVVEAIVNHISAKGGAKAGVAGVYNKALYLDERREALEAWALFVAALVAPPQPKEGADEAAPAAAPADVTV